MTQPKKLIEVALPVQEISTESLRDKSIRHGHISTLHLWWARRPLPVCRAVVFASIVPDPLDPHCPPAFCEAVQRILGPETGRSDHYKPYEDIPHTAAEDRMEDNLRNRLLMFIGKFSEKYVSNEKTGKNTPAKDKLSGHSLIKWDNKNNETVLQRARRLIYVAHNARLDPDRSARELIAEHDRLWAALKKAEKELYAFPDRHLGGERVERLEAEVEEAKEDFLSRMPKVFDPFAGGGAIPLEAARLGCRSYGNDINPVAHIIQRGSVEFPQRYGKPMVYSPDEFIRRYGKTFHQTWCREHMTGTEDPIEVDNRLALDVEYFARELLQKVEEQIGQYYPKDEKGKRPIAYYWARVGTCSNPTCRAEVPLLKQFYLVNKPDKKVHLKPIIRTTEIDFEIREGKIEEEGWVSRGNFTCPCCQNMTDVKNLKKQFKAGKIKEKLLAIIEDGTSGKKYRLPSEGEKDIVNQIPKSDIPTEVMHRNSAGGDTFSWGVNKWGQMFSPRQLLAMQTFVSVLNDREQQWYDEKGRLSDYDRAVLTYLAIWVDRIAPKQVSFIIWDSTRETVSNLFGRQAIPMIFDYPESNPFSERTGSALNQLNWIVRYIESESTEIPSVVNHAASGVRSQFGEKELDVVVTDPPYYDAIAYADLSDFFYVWLKRTLGTVFPENFITPQTPKTDECTALKHHHQNDGDQARKHFDHTLTRIFDAIEYQTRDLVSIMFAHQSTEAWTTLCNSIISARMNITGSWAMDSEYTNTGLKKSKDFLTSSVSVSCKPIIKKGMGDFQTVQQEVRRVIREEVKKLYALGFRGADLLTACFGQAVSVFGRYERVETPDGEPVTVARLLSLARDAAFEAIVQDIPADERTRFYIGWLQLYGFSEAEHDDVRRLAQLGLNMDRDLIYRHHLLIKKDNRASLGRMAERIDADEKLGNSKNSDAIDTAHRLMFLWQSGNRSRLLQYIHRSCPAPDHVVWRVLNSLLELLPAEKKFRDRETVTNLLAARESLLREVRARESEISQQSEIDF